MNISRERRERALAEAMSFDQFMNSMQVNRQAFLDNYEAFQLSEADLTFFTSLNEPLEVLILAHDWCGDTVANLPLFGKIEQETGKLHLHILLRDPHNTDIAAAYPHTDRRNHIPTYIFFNQAGEELGIFSERPDEITHLIPAWQQSFYAEQPQLVGRELSETEKLAKQNYVKQYRTVARKVEQAAIIKIIRQIIAPVPTAQT